MERDYFAILGLTPGRYTPDVIERHFRDRRHRLLAALDEPALHQVSRAHLDDLHVAYRTLSDPDRQKAYLARQGKDADASERMRWAIAAAMEDGLLRYSRRQELLALGHRFGFTEFQVQLLIAQVQFGDEAIDLPIQRTGGPTRETGRTWRPWWAALAVLLLAVALFLLMLSALQV